MRRTDNPIMTRAVVAVSLVLLAVCLGSYAPARGFLSSSNPVLDTTFDRWFVLEITGERAGWMHLRVERESDRITTHTQTELNLLRGKTKIKVRTATRFIETLAGEPVSMWSKQKLGSVPIETYYEFEENEVIVRTTQGGSVTTRRMPRPSGQALTPAAAESLLREQIEAGAVTIVLRLLDPATGATPVEMTRTIVNRHVEVEALGRTFDAVETRLAQRQSGGGDATAVEFLDQDGRLLRSVTTMGDINLTLIASDRRSAMRPVKAPEVMISLAVRPDRSIRSARRATRLVADLSVSKGQMPDLPGTDAQTTVRETDGHARVTINASDRVLAGAADAVPTGPAETAVFLESSSYLSHDDPAIRRLLRRATRNAGKEPSARAEAMRKYVHGYVKQKDLSVGFATAREVARTKTGDCTEHGVLLAALLRADGIPSRVVAGLIYADRFGGERSVFVYHMWAQALIGGRWIDYDATLSARRFDATHIALSTSSLSDGAVFDSLSSMIPLLGRLEIRIEEVEY